MTEPSPVVPVHDNRAAHRFELEVEGQPGILTYQRNADTLVLLHTEVAPPIRGRRLGEALVKAGLDAARAEGLRVVAVCPFVQAYLRKHPNRG